MINFALIKSELAREMRETSNLEDLELLEARLILVQQKEMEMIRFMVALAGLMAGTFYLSYNFDEMKDQYGPVLFSYMAQFKSDADRTRDCVRYKVENCQ